MDNTVETYFDIIAHPRHISEKRPHMSQYDRAAQFAPYAALVGFEDLVAETGRLVDDQLIMSEEEADILDKKISILISRIKEQPEVSVTYFVPDPLKEGGKYMTQKKQVRRIEEATDQLICSDKTVIKLSDIVDLNCDLFKEYF